MGGFINWTFLMSSNMRFSLNRPQMCEAKTKQSWELTSSATAYKASWLAFEGWVSRYRRTVLQECYPVFRAYAQHITMMEYYVKHVRLLQPCFEGVFFGVLTVLWQFSVDFSFG